jgi:hypothetical protein
MTPFSLVLFVHITAVLVLFAALSVEGLSLFHLRRISTLAAVHQWIELIPGLPLITMASLLIVLISGIYLTMRMSAPELAWPKIALGAVLLMAPFGALSGRRMRSIRRACNSEKTNIRDLIKQLQDPLLKLSVSIRGTVLVGIVLLMVAKPDWRESVGIVGASIAVGLVAPAIVRNRANWLPLSGTDPEN